MTALHPQRRRPWQLLALLSSALLFGGCASGGGHVESEDSCTYRHYKGLCEATVDMHPRAADSPDEGVTLHVNWRWLGTKIQGVPDRKTSTYLRAREALALSNAIRDIGKSPCVVQAPIASETCQAPPRIIEIEAE